MKEYLNFQARRVSYKTSWWTLGWALFSPRKLEDLRNAVHSDQNTLLNFQKMYLGQKGLGQELNAKILDLKGQIKDSEITAAHRTAVLLNLKSELEGNLAGRKKTDKERKWISSMIKSIDAAMEVTAEDLKKECL